jgi:hypothetical protein
MLLLVAYYVATPGVFQGKHSGDGFFGFEYLNAIVHHGTLDMKTVIPTWQPYFGTDAVTHHMPNRNPIGPVFVWLPFYLIATALAPLLKAIGVLKAAAPDSPFHAWVTGLGSLASVLVGWRFVYRTIARHTSETAAALGSTLAVWATPIAWYAVTQPFYQHAVTFLFVALFVERWDARYGDGDWRRFAWLGAIGGVAMMMRAQEVLYFFLPGGEIVARLARGPNAERKRFFVGGVVMTLAAVIAFAPQAAAWWFYTGHLRAPQIEPLRLGEPMLVVALFSTRAGLFPWTPIAYASLVGVVRPGRAARLTLGLLAVFLVEIYICSTAWVPSGAYSYGARRLSDGALLIGLGVALLFHRLSSTAWRRVVLGFSALCVLLCVFTMEMQRQRKTQSSGGFARTGARYLADAGAPRWAQTLIDRVGYPFVQPAGWLFALKHHVGASAFEGIVGNFMLDREGQWFTVLDKALPLDAGNRSYVASGLELSPDASKAPSMVTGHVRLLPSMFASEPITVQVAGEVPPGAIEVKWNGTSVAAVANKVGFSFRVEKSLVNVGVNELELDVPAGARLKQLEFAGSTSWWK